MATHGLLIGAAAATGLYAVVKKKSFLALADTMVIPGAFLLGVGRLGNFIDGQIVGSVTDVWWGVKFPYADGFRHPVVLYDGVKNLLLMLFLLHVRRTNPTPGAVAARFVFWYTFPRIFIDLFRDYPTHRLALGTGQTLNLVMAAIGVVLLVRSRLRRLGRLKRTAMAVPLVVRPRGPAALGAAGRALGSAGVLHDDPEQLDAEHPGPVWRAPSRSHALMAVSTDRLGASRRHARAARHRDSGALTSNVTTAS